MKKILSLALAAAMMVSAIPAAYAAENEADYSAGTQITLNGSGTEAYTVTVPATMSPGDTGTVKAEGTWAADKFLQIWAPSTVALTYGAQSMDVAITGGKFSLIGNSVDPVSKEVEISVEDANRLFGTWEGVLEYTVIMHEKGDVNRDGVINDDDYNMIGTYLGENEYTDEEKGIVETYGDLNSDGKIDSLDWSQIRRVIANTFTVAPAQSE